MPHVPAGDPNTAAGQIANAQARIDHLLAQSESFIVDLQTFVTQAFDLDPPGSRTFSILTGAGLADAINNQPERPDGLSFVSPGNVAAPPVLDIRDATIPVLPDAPGDSPQILIPAAPIISFPASPTAPQVAPVAIPTAPDFTLPPTPVLAQIVIPTPQSIALPTFSAQFPADTLLFAPTPFNYSEPEFSDELLDEIKSQHLDDLLNGGFGIDPRDEEQLVGRLRDREARGGRTNESQVLRNFASRGHHLPSGSLDDALRSAQQDTQARISAGEREVFTVRSDLFRKTREFILSNGTTLESLLITLFGFRQERALKAAVFVSEFSIASFDAQVRQFNTRIAAYGAQVQSHETLVRAELAKIEIFRSEIEAQRLISELNQQDVALFTAQINAVQAVVNIFETEMRAASIEAEIQRLKIQQFGEEVSAYSSLIGAEVAKIQVFEAQIKGEVTKLGVFQTEVQTYTAEVQAAATKTQIENLNVQTDIERGKLDLQRYDGEIRQFTANLSREIERVGSLTKVYDSDINSFRTLIDGWAAFYANADSATAQFLQQVSNNADRDIEITKVELSRLQSETQVRLDATSRGVTNFENLIQAAQSAANTLVVQEDVS
jgi:hypothetical protein